MGLPGFRGVLLSAVWAWFPEEGKTCAQYGVEDCDNELVHRACRQTCALPEEASELTRLVRILNTERS